MVKINITFKILGTGLSDNYQANIKIYDKCNHLIYDGKTYNGKYLACLQKNKGYCLNIQFGSINLTTSFYVLNQDTFVFNFNQVVNSNSITFRLTDYNYDNLPIMKGEMLIG